MIDLGPMEDPVYPDVARLIESRNQHQKRLGAGTMNTDRKAIIRYLAALQNGTNDSTHWVAVGCALGYDDAERELLALDVLGLADFSGAGWSLTEAGREFAQSRMAS